MNSFVILALMLCIPVALVTTLILQKQKMVGRESKNFIICVMGISFVAALVVLFISEGSRFAQTADRELLSGQITSKERKHGHYIRSYQCNCSTDSKGNRTCQTCYEDRYTVDWTADSTLGSYNIESLDRSSKRAYLAPDPQRYTEISVGDPVAASRYYKNYMLGVPKEHLHNDNLGASPELIAKVGDYPQVFDVYKVNRVRNIDGVLSSKQELEYNTLINNKLRSLGPHKEVNILLVAGKPDENLVYAVRERWNGGKKNDVIVVLGVEENEVRNVNVLTWAKNELFKLKLQDRIDENKTLDGILGIVFDEIEKSYVRPQMKDYEDLSMYIEPPMWALILIFVLLLGTPVGAIIVGKFGKFK